MPQIIYHNGTMQIDHVSIEALASRYPTPFYCYSASAIRQQYLAFADAFADLPALICYAIKANSNQAILTLLAKLGAGADVVSEGELRRALAAGIPADKIVFSGVAKTATEIRFALSKNILCFNVESITELRQISALASANQQTAKVSMRINPDVDAGTHAKISTGKRENKFGIPFDYALQAYQLAATLPGITIVGIDMHIGSQISKVSAFDEAMQRIMELIKQLQELGINLEHVDVGGGLGVTYTDDDPSELTLLAEYSRVIHKYATALNCRIIFEPGRFIIANAGILVTEVIQVKPVQDKTFVMIDAAMNDLIRPTLYEAWHKISPAKQAAPDALSQPVDIVGPVCESGDYMAQNRPLTTVVVGDLLVIHSVGAYSAVASNTYNSRRLIAEVLVDGERDQLIRPSLSYRQLIELDSVPDWL